MRTSQCKNCGQWYNDGTSAGHMCAPFGQFQYGAQPSQSTPSPQEQILRDILAKLEDIRLLLSMRLK